LRRGLPADRQVCVVFMFNSRFALTIAFQFLIKIFPCPCQYNNNKLSVFLVDTVRKFIVCPGVSYVIYSKAKRFAQHQTPGRSPHRCGGPPPFTKGGWGLDCATRFFAPFSPHFATGFTTYGSSVAVRGGSGNCSPCLPW